MIYRHKYFSIINRHIYKIIQRRQRIKYMNKITDDYYHEMSVKHSKYDSTSIIGRMIKHGENNGKQT